MHARTHARTRTLLPMFCTDHAPLMFQLNGYSVPTLSAQYFHHRFHGNFFNDTTDPTVNDTTSNCDSNGSSPVEKQEAALQEYVADFQMYLSYASIGPMIVATVVLGSMSDFLGRRFLFLLPCITSLIKQVRPYGVCCDAALCQTSTSIQSCCDITLIKQVRAYGVCCDSALCQTSTSYSLVVTSPSSNMYVL